jgi:hypothetical protein
MKYFLFFIFFFSTAALKAQKYALLDEHLAEPVTFTNTVTPADKFKGLFPVEKKLLPHFIKALEEIEYDLSSKKPLGEVKQYYIGCVKFRGIKVLVASEERLDYVITSNCDNVIISMHLSDAKISSTHNAYFIKTWIKYIKSYLK